MTKPAKSAYYLPIWVRQIAQRRSQLAVILAIFNGSSRGRFTALQMVSTAQSHYFAIAFKTYRQKLSSNLDRTRLAFTCHFTTTKKTHYKAYLDKQNIDTQVEIAMTYGNPSIQSAVQNLLKNQVERIIVLPLYPQYSSSTTGAVFDAFANALKEERGLVPFDFIHSYHVNENYINALANSIKVRLKSDEFCYFLITVFLCVMKKWAIIIVNIVNKRLLQLLIS